MIEIYNRLLVTIIFKESAVIFNDGLKGLVVIVLLIDQILFN